jgi:cytochrome c oxidase cbb3-type subunit 3
MTKMFSRAVAALAAAFLVAGAAPAAFAADVTEDAIQATSKDSEAMAKAQKTFATTCASCHGPQGAGMVGPNLTDNFWLKGSKGMDIFKSISEGAPAKGMPPMAPQLGGPDGVKNLAAYVLTLKGKNLAGKPPQGTEEK